jgi:hypothetical protein
MTDAWMVDDTPNPVAMMKSRAAEILGRVVTIALSTHWTGLVKTEAVAIRGSRAVHPSGKAIRHHDLRRPVPFQLASRGRGLEHAVPEAPVVLASLVLLHLLVRVDAPAAIKPATVAGIAAEVRGIWKPYGVDVSFALPGEAVTGEPGEEIRLVITDRLLAGTRGASGDVAGVGWIEFLGPEQPARLITVSVAAASTLADRARWAGIPVGLLPAVIRQQFLVHALGRATAHEIGHYLLRSAVHARAGLMRPRFAAEDVMDDHLTRFRLEPAQVETFNRSRPAQALQAALPQ